VVYQSHGGEQIYANADKARMIQRTTGADAVFSNPKGQFVFTKDGEPVAVLFPLDSSSFPTVVIPKGFNAGGGKSGGGSTPSGAMGSPVRNLSNKERDTTSRAESLGMGAKQSDPTDEGGKGIIPARSLRDHDYIYYRHISGDIVGEHVNDIQKTMAKRPERIAQNEFMPYAFNEAEHSKRKDVIAERNAAAKSDTAAAKQFGARAFDNTSDVVSEAPQAGIPEYSPYQRTQSSPSRTSDRRLPLPLHGGPCVAWCSRAWPTTRGRKR
jgi:hypothetical protein